MGSLRITVASDLYDPFCGVECSPQARKSGFNSSRLMADMTRMKKTSPYTLKDHSWRAATKLKSPITELTCVAPQSLQYDLSAYLVRREGEQPSPSAEIFQYYSGLYDQENDGATHERMEADQTLWTKTITEEGALLRLKMRLIKFKKGSMHIRARLVFPYYLADTMLSPHVNTLLEACKTETDFIQLMNILDDLSTKERHFYIPLFARYGIHKKHIEEQYHFQSLIEVLGRFPQDKLEDLCKRTQGLFTKFCSTEDEIKILEGFSKIPQDTRHIIISTLEDLRFFSGKYKNSSPWMGFAQFLNYFILERDRGYFIHKPIDPANLSLLLKVFDFSHRSGLFENCDDGYALFRTLDPLLTLVKKEEDLALLDALTPSNTGIDYKKDLKSGGTPGSVLGTLIKLDPRQVPILVQLLKELNLYYPSIEHNDFGGLMEGLHAFTASQRALFASCIMQEGLNDSQDGEGNAINTKTPYVLPALQEEERTLLRHLNDSGILTLYKSGLQIMQLLELIFKLEPPQQERILNFIAAHKLCNIEGDGSDFNTLISHLSTYTENDFLRATEILSTALTQCNNMSVVKAVLDSVKNDKTRPMALHLLTRTQVVPHCTKGKTFMGLVDSYDTLTPQEKTTLTPLIQTPGLLGKIKDQGDIKRLFRILKEMSPPKRIVLMSFITENNLLDLCSNGWDVYYFLEDLQKMSIRERVRLVRLQALFQHKSYGDLLRTLKEFKTVREHCIDSAIFFIHDFFPEDIKKYLFTSGISNVIDLRAIVMRLCTRIPSGNRQVFFETLKEFGYLDKENLRAISGDISIISTLNRTAMRVLLQHKEVVNKALGYRNSLDTFVKALKHIPTSFLSVFLTNPAVQQATSWKGVSRRLDPLYEEWRSTRPVPGGKTKEFAE